MTLARIVIAVRTTARIVITVRTTARIESGIGAAETTLPTIKLVQKQMSMEFWVRLTRASHSLRKCN